MPLETASYIHQLVPSNPPGSDRIFQGDDHIRMVKAALKATFPNITGPVTLSHTAINALAASIVPFGTISLWYGAADSVPAGWTICDGDTVPKSDGSGNVTVPDLRGKVPIGANETYAQGSTYGNTTQAPSTNAGGAHNHAATLASGGAHSHTATSSSENAGGVVTSTRNVDGSGNSPVPVINSVVNSSPTHAHTITVAEGGAHTHDATISDGGSHTHTIPAFSVLQPSLALHYIMKV